MPVRLTVRDPLSSFMLRLPIGFKVGGSFTGFTVTLNVRVTTLFEAPLSLTVTVITTVPATFVRGAKVKLPLVFGLV